MGNCWRSKGELISDILLLNFQHWYASVGWPRKTYRKQLCTDTRCSLEDLPKAIKDRDALQESISESCVSSTTWWWWWWWKIVWIQNFPSSRLVPLHKVNYRISPTIYIDVEEHIDSCILHRHQGKETRNLVQDLNLHHSFYFYRRFQLQ